MTQIFSDCFFVPQISQIYTDLDLFGLWDDADFSSSDYAELSDEKSAKSVGLYIMQFWFLDRTGRFPYKFRA